MSDSDRELLRRTAQGERAAFDAFVERHAAGVWRYVRSLVGDETEAEEALQQTFVSAWKHAEQAQAENGAKPWLYAIARRATFKRVDARKRREERECSLDELGERAGFGDERCTPERMAQWAEQRECIEAALGALDPHEREILVLRELEGLDGATTAEILGISLAAQKSRLHRARLNLAARLRHVADGNTATGART